MSVMKVTTRCEECFFHLSYLQEETFGPVVGIQKVGEFNLSRVLKGTDFLACRYLLTKRPSN